MDCHTADSSAAGIINPKYLQTEPAFSFSSWEQPRYESVSEWITNQDPNSPADFLDPNSLHDSLSDDLSDIPLLDQSGGLMSANFSNQDTSPESSGLGDGPVDGTGTGTASPTVSPKTLPSSSDENIEAWSQLHLYNTLAMPTESPLLYPCAKDYHDNSPSNPLVVEDTGEPAQNQGYADALQPNLAMSFHQMPQFPLMPSSWANATSTAPAENIVPAPENGGDQTLRNFQHTLGSLEWSWLGDMDAQAPVQSTASLSAGLHDLGLEQDLQNGAEVSQTQQKSENSSASGDIPGLYDFPCFTASGDTPAFTQQQSHQGVDMKHAQWKDKPQAGSPSVSPGYRAATEFVNGAPSESMVHFPLRASAVPLSRRNSVTRTPLSLQSMATVKKRKQKTPSISLEQPPSTKPLQIVQEDGKGGAVASADFVSPPRGARRKGPLSTAGRANAGMRRKNKDTCVQCRLNKRKCDGHSPCDACRPTLHEQPCARACFANIVEFGTCNYISQRAINHPTGDGLRRMRMEIPSAFDLNDLLSFLNERQGRFNIRATQPWGSLYVLDLGETYKFLKSMTEVNSNGRSTFLEFIDRRLVESRDKSKNWIGCLRDCDPTNNAYALLSQWNNMPSRARYSFVPLHPTETTSEQPMDITNPDHKRDILMAAQLSRIVCRMLEVEGFRKLERDFYNIKWKQISQDAHLRFLNELGHILLSLRWRVSWWKRLGDGGQQPDPSQQHYVDRVELLCRILYVYYTCVLAKLPSWSSADVTKGVWSTYADVENPVWDDFPLDATDAGFHRWMDRGRDLIEEAGVPKRVSAGDER